MISLASWAFLISCVVAVNHGYEIECKRPDDKVEVTAGAEQVTFSIKSPSGIGSVTIRPLESGWPKQADLVLRFHPKGLEQVRIVNGDTELGVSISSHDGKSSASLKRSNKETQRVDKSNRYWAEAKQSAGKEYFELKLPKAMLTDQHMPITIYWIDFFR